MQGVWRAGSRPSLRRPAEILTFQERPTSRLEKAKGNSVPAHIMSDRRGASGIETPGTQQGASHAARSDSQFSTTSPVMSRRRLQGRKVTPSPLREKNSTLSWRKIAGSGYLLRVG
jgi:hypothetical protein